MFNTIYDNSPPLTAAELFDSSWSDSDSFDDYDSEGYGEGGLDDTYKDKDPPMSPPPMSPLANDEVRALAAATVIRFYNGLLQQKAIL